MVRSLTVPTDCSIGSRRWDLTRDIFDARCFYCPLITHLTGRRPIFHLPRWYGVVGITFIVFAHTIERLTAQIDKQALAPTPVLHLCSGGGVLLLIV